MFKKFYTHHSRLNSVRYAKFRAIRKIYRYFGAPFTLNRTKIYMGSIPKSETILTKLDTHHSTLNSVRCAKLRANRKIYGALVYNLH